MEGDIIVLTPYVLIIILLTLPPPVQVALAPGTGASRGFAFVDMSSSQEAELAQMSCNGTVFSGQAIRVSFGMPCRLGASILQHKPSVLHVSAASY